MARLGIISLDFLWIHLILGEQRQGLILNVFMKNFGFPIVQQNVAWLLTIHITLLTPVQKFGIQRFFCKSQFSKHPVYVIMERERERANRSLKISADCCL